MKQNIRNKNSDLKQSAQSGVEGADRKSATGTPNPGCPSGEYIKPYLKAGKYY
jgi:hypothetical protein